MQPARGFCERNVGLASERTQFIANDIQAQRRQYGLKYPVTPKMHATMGDTLPLIAIEISDSDILHKLWDKAQALVLSIRTKFAVDLIFLGDRSATIEITVEDDVSVG